MEEGRCVGVEAEVSGGLVQIRANAVALADGGFQSNLELMKRFIAPKPDRLMQRNAGTGGGDALLMAEAVGAKLIGTESFYGHLLYREAFRDDRFWPYPMLDTTVTGSIVVDASGRRFCDEGRGGIYVANMIARHDDPLSVTAVFDSAIWNEGPARNFLLPANPNFTKAGGQLLRANTVHELAARIGVDSDALTRTVNAHNKVARGEAPEADSVPRTTATYRPWAIEKPPFLAVPVCAGITYTLGGIATDADGQVIADSNKPIRGLFAAGACTGGLEGGSGVGYSGGLSKSSVFGLRAGERIVNELEHS
jgi:fumarate reductase flavoprotein subunit